MHETDGNITPAWLLAFDHWVAIMVGATGLLGCVVSLKHFSSCLHQSASPRSRCPADAQLKRHQSDLCDIKADGLPDDWQATSPDMVGKFMARSAVISNLHAANVVWYSGIAVEIARKMLRTLAEYHSTCCCFGASPVLAKRVSVCNTVCSAKRCNSLADAGGRAIKDPSCVISFSGNALL